MTVLPGDWLICFAIMLLIGGVTMYFRGVPAAMGAIVVFSFVLPVWPEAQVIGITLRPQSAAAILSLQFLLFGAPRLIWSPILVLDVAITLMVCIQSAADARHGVWLPESALRAYGEWGVPYVAGRYAMRKAGNIDFLAVLVSGVVIILGIGGMVEILTGTNLWESIFGVRPLDLTPRDMSRFGFKRAYGPTLHPIFFGLLFLVLVPWPLTLSLWGRRPFEKTLAMLGLGAMTGIVSPVSRSPVLALGLFAALTSAVHWRWLRWPLGIGAVLLSGWMIFSFDDFLVTVEKLGGEVRHDSKFVVQGEKIERSAATHRVVLLKVYGPAFLDAGLLGYGTKAVTGFPPDVPHLSTEQKTRHALRSVDNAYLLLGLRSGWLGVAAFVILLLSTIFVAFRLAEDRSISLLASALASMICAMTVTLWTVWLSYDVGFEFMWTIGIIAGLRVQQID